jgi:GAF domain-containing protein
VPGVHDTQRIAALRATGLLDSAPEPVFDRLTSMVVRLLRVPIALVSLIDEDRAFYKSQQGLPEPWASARQTPITRTLCQYAITQGGELFVSNAREDDRVRDNPSVIDNEVTAYAGVPIEDQIHYDEVADAAEAARRLVDALLGGSDVD